MVTSHSTEDDGELMFSVVTTTLLWHINKTILVTLDFSKKKIILYIFDVPSNIILLIYYILATFVMYLTLAQIGSPITQTPK